MNEENKIQPTADQKLWAALGYVWVMTFIVLMTKNDPYVRRHAKQGLLLFVGECIIFVPILGMLIGWLVSFLSVVFAFIGFFKALQGTEWKVPFLGDWWENKIKI